MTAVRDTCRNGLLDWSPRLMLAMYSCDIQAASEFLMFWPPKSRRFTDLFFFRSGRSGKGLRSRHKAKRPHSVRRDERGHLVLYRVCSTPCCGKFRFCGRYGRVYPQEVGKGSSITNAWLALPDVRKRTSGAASPQLIFSG